MRRVNIIGVYNHITNEAGKVVNDDLLAVGTEKEVCEVLGISRAYLFLLYTDIIGKMSAVKLFTEEV